MKYNKFQEVCVLSEFGIHITYTYENYLFIVPPTPPPRCKGLEKIV